MKTWKIAILAASILSGCLFSSADNVKNPINYSINQETLVNEAFQNVSQDHLSSVITKLSSYANRSAYTQLGIDSFDWIVDHWKELTKNRTDVEITRFTHTLYKQPTIILTIKGSDPVLQNEIIILSAHGDTINNDTNDVNAVAPGADDNASGVATISEILRRLVELDYKPQRTIQFIVYAAEEPTSDRASYELTRWYRQNNKNVVGVMNYDQTNYKTGPYDIVLIGDYTSVEQNAFIGNLIDTYLKVPWTTQNCGYQCSDHAAWNIEGYPASLAFESYLEGENPNIHTHKDTFHTMNNSTEHSVLFVKLGLAFAIELDK
ncbi:aminopeptidase [Bdellovibrio sp. qaytius]|nr:aminopeptidase [Bdellovibrio sp. qaytius]